MTFYLKYRPQTTQELDLVRVREQLQKIVASGNIPHALLFSGPRGAGKTSAARILAKVVNCTSLEQRTKNKEQSGNKGHGTFGAEPCNKCSQCVSITNGSNLDVIEIDAASHRGIDDIRSLRETIKLAPAGSKKKVYIIDEAHMLTTEAFNALLKTLEEPPSHAMFILATTAPEKLPDTIRSRCTGIIFYKGLSEEVVGSLQKVVKGEHLEIEDGVLEAIAGLADGSFREAHKILEQLSTGGKEITVSMVRGLALSSTPDAKELIDLISGRKTKEALEEIERVAKEGANLKLYSIEVVAYLRKALLSSLGVGEKMDVGMDDNKLRHLIELFSEAILKIPTAVIPQLPIELAVIESAEETVTEIQIGTDKDKRGGEKPGLVHNSRLDPVERARLAISKSELEDKWREVMKQVKIKNHSVEALLRAARPLSLEGTVLMIEVFYKFHKDTLEKDSNRRVVEEIAGQVLGMKLILRCTLSETRQKASDVANLGDPQDEDIVKVAEEIFGAKGDGKVH